MALVDYASSEEDEKQDDTALGYLPIAPPAGHKELKRKRDSHSATKSGLPPLPSKFHDLYVSKARVSTQDDPSLHGGRKRITPHVEGNWPSHVYIEWYPSTTEHDLLTSLITTIQNETASASEIELVSLLTSDLGSPLPLHVSLSRPIVFVAAQKDSFVESLHRNIVDCGVRPFELRFGNLSWVSNFEKTRWFLVLQLQKPEGDELNRLLTVCNETVEDYSQPPLYGSPRSASQQSSKANARPKRLGQGNMSPSPGEGDILDFSSAFHVSIGWALEQPSSYVSDTTKAATEDTILESLKTISAKVDTLKVKVGNIVTSISLATKAVEGKGLFGA